MLLQMVSVTATRGRRLSVTHRPTVKTGTVRSSPDGHGRCFMFRWHRTPVGGIRHFLTGCLYWHGTTKKPLSFANISKAINIDFISAFCNAGHTHYFLTGSIFKKFSSTDVSCRLLDLRKSNPRSNFPCSINSLTQLLKIIIFCHKTRHTFPLPGGNKVGSPLLRPTPARGGGCRCCCGAAGCTATGGPARARRSSPTACAPARRV